MSSNAETYFNRRRVEFATNPLVEVSYPFVYSPLLPWFLILMFFVVTEDLRNRHQRRCVAKIGEQRSSRQKSCARCVASKLRCDLSLPACKRCCARSPFTPCIYPHSPFNSSLAPLQPSSEENGDSQLPTRRTNEDAGNFAMDITQHATLEDATTLDTFVSSSSFGPEASFLRTPASNSPYSFDNYHELLSSQWSIPPSVGNQIDLCQLLAVETSAFASDMVFDNQSPLPSHFTSTNMQIPQMITPPVGPHEEASSIDGAFNRIDVTDDWVDAFNGNGNPVPTSLVASCSGDNETQYSPSLYVEGHGTSQLRVPDFMSLERMMEVLRSYPINMLEKDYCPPFLHHSLYRCSEGGLDERIAIALCCVGAMKTITDKSAGFVGNLVNIQREGLLADFHAIKTLMRRLAGLHALHLYQMLGLLYSECSYARQHIREAEMNHSFFLKIVRWTILEYLKEKGSLSIDQEDWKSWCEAETLRRTILLVHVSNFLGICFERRNMFYYEPLDDDLVHSLWLPAPEAMWQATNEDAWKKAKKAVNYGAWGQTTMSSLVKSFQREDRVLYQGVIQTFGDLPELTRLILSCMSMNESIAKRD